MSRIGVICLVIIIFLQSGIGQIRYGYQQFTIENGLPTNAIYDIVEGRDGKMYIGTDNGLSIFDGVQFKNYNTKDGLYNPYVVSVTNGLNSEIFCATYYGNLCKYDSGKIAIYRNRLTSTDELYLFKDRFWVRGVGKGYDGKRHLMYTSYTELQYNSREVKSDYNLGNIEQTPKQFLDRTKNHPTIISYQGRPIIVSNRMFCIKGRKITMPFLPLINKVEIGIDKIYLFTDSHLVVTNYNGEILRSIQHPYNINDGTNRLYTMLDKKGDLWMNIQLKGLFKLEADNWTCVNERLGFKKEESINKIYCDSKGRIWICTFNSGLFLIPSTDISHIFDSREENRFTGMAVIDSNIYITSRFRLYKYCNYSLREMHKETSELKFGKLENRPVLFGSFTKQLPFRNVESFVGRKILLHKGKILTYGSGASLSYYSSRSEFQYIRNYKFKSSKILSIGDTLLCANGDSVYKATIYKNLLLKHHYALKLKTDGFIYDMILHHDTLIVAESNQLKYFYKNKLVKKYTSINGVPIESVYKIERCYKKLWIYTNNGIFCLGDDGSSKVINRRNYLPSNEVTDVLQYKNDYYFTTQNGIAIIPTKELESVTSKPLIKISNYISDREYSIDDNIIPLNPEDNYLKIICDIKISTNKENLVIQYSLNEGDWINSNPDGIILNNLASGKMKFKIRAKDVNSEWAFADVTIDKQFPFYLRWWFILGILFIISLAYYNYHRFLLRKEIQLAEVKNKMSSQIIELRQSALSAMMNPHFIFNSLNAIQYFINSNQKEKSSEYLAKLSRLVRLFLNHASETSILLSEEIDRLNRYVELEQMRFYPFQFVISISENLEIDKIFIPNMILQPLVENAILHGISHLESKDGLITLEISMNNKNLLRLSITDNGYGMDRTTYKESSHVSKALSIIKERIDIMQKMEPSKVNMISNEVPYPMSKRKGHRILITLSI